MNDQDFLRSFGGNLDRENQATSSQFDPAWDNLSNRLDIMDKEKLSKSKNRALFFPLLNLAGLLLLGTMLYQSKIHEKDLTSKIVTLEKKITRLDNTHNTSTTNKISYTQYDTIYKTIVITSAIQNNSSIYARTENNKSNALGRTSYTEPSNETSQVINQVVISSELTNQNKLDDPKNTEPSKSSNLKATANNIGVANDADLPKNDIEKEIIAIDNNNNIQTNHHLKVNADTSVNNQAITDIDSKPVFVPDYSENTLDDIKPQKKPFFEKINWPTLNAITFRTGMLSPITPYSHPPFNFTAGLGIDFSLSSRLNLLIRSDFSNYILDVNPDEFVLANVPIITAPGPDHIIEDVHINQPVLNHSMGIKYYLYNFTHHRPYVLGLWTVEQSLEKTLNYNFKNTANHETSKVSILDNKVGSNLSGIQIGIGTDFKLRNGFSLFPEVSYKYQKLSGLRHINQVFGFTIGLKYHF